MALLLLAAGAGYGYYQQQQEAKYHLDDGIDLDHPTVRSIQLTPFETSAYILQSSISTITFFELCNGNNPYVATIPALAMIEDRLRRRVDRIRAANPWLGGVLARKRPRPVANPATTKASRNGSGENQPENDDDDDNLKLWYGTAIATPSSFRSFRATTGTESGEEPSLRLSASTPYQDYENILSEHNLRVPSTRALLGSAREPLWKVSLVPDADHPTTRFALVVSMAHLLGDAHTFYQLYAMLNHLDQDDDDDGVLSIQPPPPTEENAMLETHVGEDRYGGRAELLASDYASQDLVWALNPRRVPEYRAQVIERLGETEAAFLAKTNPAVWETEAVRALGRRFWGSTEDNVARGEGKKKSSSVPSSAPPSHELVLFTVHPRWLEHVRRLHQQEEEQPAVFPTTTHADSLRRSVSKEALLHWWFFDRIVQPTVALVAQSTRNYVPCLGVFDAGNYQTPIPLASDDYRRPHLIQKALGTGRRAGAAPPPSPRSTTEQSGTATKTPTPQQPLPTAGSYSTFAYGVDWSRFCQHEVALWGGEGGPVTQGKHLPLFQKSDLSCLPPRVSGMVVFSATPSTLGALCIVPRDKMKRILTPTSGLHDPNYDAERVGMGSASPWGALEEDPVFIMDETIALV